MKVVGFLHQDTVNLHPSELGWCRWITPVAQSDHDSAFWHRSQAPLGVAAITHRTVSALGRVGHFYHDCAHKMQTDSNTDKWAARVGHMMLLDRLSWSEVIIWPHQRWTLNVKALERRRDDIGMMVASELLIFTCIEQSYLQKTPSNCPTPKDIQFRSSDIRGFSHWIFEAASCICLPFFRRASKLPIFVVCRFGFVEFIWTQMFQKHQMWRKQGIDNSQNIFFLYICESGFQYTYYPSSFLETLVYLNMHIF